MAVVVLKDRTVLKMSKDELPEKLRDSVFKQKVYSWLFKDDEEN
jgi:hypothetical protein